MGRHTARIRHLHVIHIPVPACGVGVVAEGDAGTRGCAGEVFGLLLIGVAGPVVVVVGGHGHKGGGI